MKEDIPLVKIVVNTSQYENKNAIAQYHQTPFENQRFS